MGYKMRRMYGFTFVELLAVIAVTALLAALLFPVFSQVREKARQTNCLANMRQIALAQMMYVENWDERFPHWYFAIWSEDQWRYVYWTEFLQPYIKNQAILFDPSYVWPEDIKPDRRLASYSMHTWGPYGRGTLQEPNWRWPGPDMTLSEIRRPAETFNIFDGWTTPEMTSGIMIRHHDGLNGAFLDGHARWITRNSVFSLARDQDGFYYRYIAANRD